MKNILLLNLANVFLKLARASDKASDYLISKTDKGCMTLWPKTRF